MSFYLTDGDRGVAVHVEDDDDDDDDEYETPSSTAPPSRRNRHGRTYGPHTESLVGLFSLPLDDEIASESISPRRHTTPPPTTTPLTSSSNCYGSFVPLPRKSAKCDDEDDDEDDDDDGDAFGSTRWQEEEEIGRPDQTTILLNTADATRWRRRTKAR